jgi:hypothetical protein
VGWGTTCTLGGREGRETGARTMDRRREDGSSYIGDSPGTEGSKSGREGEIDIATGYPLPTLAVDSGRSSSTPAHFSFSAESFTPCIPCSIHTCSLLSPSRSECGPRSAKSDLSSVAQIQQEGGFSIEKKLDGKWSHASLARVAV